MKIKDILVKLTDFLHLDWGYPSICDKQLVPLQCMDGNRHGKGKYVTMILNCLSIFLRFLVVLVRVLRRVASIKFEHKSREKRYFLCLSILMKNYLKVSKFTSNFLWTFDMSMCLPMWSIKVNTGFQTKCSRSYFMNSVMLNAVAKLKSPA